MVIKEDLAIIMLNAVKKHSRQVGVGSLALLLKGSKDKDIWNRGLNNSRFFGAIFFYPVDAIENFIRQLIKQNLIKVPKISMGFFYAPMLELAEDGKKAIDEKRYIPLNLERTIKPVVLNETMKGTLQLFLRVKDIKEVARQRNLAESTIWSHLIDCIKLNLLMPLDIINQERFQLIMGVKSRLQTNKLKELKANLPDDISYDEIRCATAINDEK